MANMGSTGTVNITHAMMDNAVQAINDYQDTITSLNQRLSTEVTTLIPSSFSGSAASSFRDVFYVNSIEPNIGENLTKMLQALTDICNVIKAQIPGESDGVDDQLGQGNKSVGGASN